MEPVKTNIQQRAYKYSLSVVLFLDKQPRNYISDVLGRQFLRSGTSVGANIIEAQSASSRRDFINFYSHALKSANESKFWIRLMKDSGRESERLGLLEQETIELSNILAACIITAKGKRRYETKEKRTFNF